MATRTRKLYEISSCLTLIDKYNIDRMVELCEKIDIGRRIVQKRTMNEICQYWD
jgi:hypothetical protein